MSKRTVRVCNGCHQTAPDVEIVQSRPRYQYLDDEEDGETIDLCGDCQDSDCYICSACHSVHDDDNLCSALKLAEV